MTNPIDEPLESGSEADRVEQEQGLDGAGSVSETDVAPDEANEADVLEQGAHVTTDEA